MKTLEQTTLHALLFAAFCEGGHYQWEMVRRERNLTPEQAVAVADDYADRIMPVALHLLAKSRARTGERHGFSADEFAYTEQLLCSGNDSIVSAALSNNLNIIIAALDIAREATGGVGKS
jgi:hypothetical protein